LFKYIYYIPEIEPMIGSVLVDVKDDIKNISFKWYLEYIEYMLVNAIDL